MINKILLTTFLFCGVFTAAAQELTSDALYLEQTKEYTFNPDGSWTYHYSHKLKINTYFAFHNLYGEDFVIFDPAYQSVKVNKSVTTMADGKQVASPANAQNELLPGFAAGIPAWNRLRELVVTHTALERGSTIDFDYTLSTKKGYCPYLSGNEALMMNSPIKKSNFIIHVPSGSFFDFETFNIPVKPIISKLNGITTYTWILNDIQPALREDFRPREQQNRPRIVFLAAAKTIDPVASFSSQPAFNCEISPELKAGCDAAISGIDDPLLKALKIQDLISGELNTWQIPLSCAAFHLRSLPEIWKSNGGTEAEKTVLLAGMLRSQNITAEPCAVVPERYYIKKTLNPALIERFLVKVSIQGKEPIFLSAVQTENQDLRFMLGGKRIIDLVPGKNQPSEVITEETNTVSLSGDLQMGNDGKLNGHLNLQLSGRLNPWMKFRKDTAAIATWLSNSFGNSKITEIVKVKSEKSSSIFSFASADGVFANEKAGHLFFKIPLIPSGSESWHMSELLSSRTEPFEIPFMLNESYDLLISIPEGYSMISAPQTLTMENEFGNIKISITSDGKKLHIVKAINLIKTYVPAEKYATFKMMMDAWNNNKYREVVLKKN